MSSRRYSLCSMALQITCLSKSVGVYHSTYFYILCRRREERVSCSLSPQTVSVFTFVVPQWRFEFCNDNKIIMFMNCVYIVYVSCAGRWIQISRAASLFPSTRLSVFPSKHTADVYTHGWWNSGEGVRGRGIPEILGSYCQHHATQCYTAAEPRRLRQRRRRRHYLAAAIVLLFAHLQSSQANRLTVWPGGCANHFFRTRIILYTHIMRTSIHVYAPYS